VHRPRLYETFRSFLLPQMSRGRTCLQGDVGLELACLFVLEVDGTIHAERAFHVPFADSYELSAPRSSAGLLITAFLRR
jgi:hypothetical protein